MVDLRLLLIVAQWTAKTICLGIFLMMTIASEFHEAQDLSIRLKALGDIVDIELSKMEWCWSIRLVQSNYWSNDGESDVILD